MRLKLLPFVFLLLTSGAFAQILNKTFYLIDGLDSAKVPVNDLQLIKKELLVYHKETSDTDKVQTLSRIIENCYDEKVWTRYNKLMLDISRAKQKNSTSAEIKVFRETEALALNNIGYYYFNYSSHIDSALIYYEKGRKINEEIGSIGMLIVSYSNIANVYQNRGDLLKAMELYTKALSLEKDTKIKTGILSATNNMANIYMYLGDTTMSILYLKRCLLLAKETNDLNMRAHFLHNIGAIESKKDPTRGMESIKNALEIRRKLGDKKGIAHSLLMLSELKIQLQDVNSANLYLNQAKELIDELENLDYVALYHRNLAQINILKGNKEEALKNYLLCLDAFKKKENLNDLMDTYIGFISFCEEYPDLHQKKLEAIEQFYYFSKAQQKGSAQRLSLQMRYENEMKIKETEQKIQDEKNVNEKRIQRNITIAISIILTLAVLFSLFIVRALKINKEKSKIIEEQKQTVEEKQKEIIDSINYSKRIQNSFIPSDAEFNETFPQSFVIYNPKDIVSGDFYWILDAKQHPTIKRNLKAIAVADCTGHGVPGAMLSMLGASILNQAILEQNVQSPADILNFLNAELKKNLRSKNNEIIRDGMDISCCLIDTDTLKMQFAGANNPCWIFRNGTITELKANKQAVTAALEENSKPFTQTEFQLQKGDILFMFTDGFADQFGGPRGKKFMYSRMEKLLINSSAMSPKDQKEILLKEFREWKGSLDQVDDVCLIGINI